MRDTFKHMYNGSHNDVTFLLWNKVVLFGF